MKKAAVIIPNWNGMRYIGGCLDSLRAQAYTDFQVYVIDNGSTDGSQDYIREHYPEAALKCLPENTGFCHAVNEGIRMSSEPFVILLNNDTKADPGMVGELVRAAAESPGTFSCQAKMLSMAEPGIIDDAGDAFCALGWAFATGRGRPASHASRRKRIFASCGGAAVYDRKKLERTGLFDEAHFAYPEDIDICYRAAVLGYKCYLAPRAVVWHAGSGASGSKYNAFKVRHSSRNSIYMIRKNMPVLQRILNLPFLAAGFGIKLAWFARKGFGKEYAAGLVAGLAMPVKEHRVPFRMGNLPHYAGIQADLWRYMFIRLGEKA